MSTGSRVFSLLSFLLVCAYAAVSQQAATSSTEGASAATAPAPSQSLADMARKMRKDKPADVKMTDVDAKELFTSVDKVFEFASKDTELAKHNAVKKRIVGQADIKKFTKDRLARADFSQRFTRSELTMKKFGLLPRDFNLREFLVKSNGQSIAGLYDEETKTIFLLNTVSLEKQGPILAHELTHALQDQNYDLAQWGKAGTKPVVKGQHGDGDEVNDESTTARHAIVEGQAMVVYIDYLLAPYGRNLKDTPGLWPRWRTRHFPPPSILNSCIRLPWCCAKRARFLIAQDYSSRPTCSPNAASRPPSRECLRSLRGTRTKCLTRRHTWIMRSWRRCKFRI